MARVQTVVVNRNSHANCQSDSGSGGIGQEQYDKILELINKKADLIHTHQDYALLKDVFTKSDKIVNNEIDFIISKL